VRLVASGIVSPELTEHLRHDGSVPTLSSSFCFADVLPQMLTVESSDGHHQLPMMYGPVTEYAVAKIVFATAAVFCICSTIIQYLQCFLKTIFTFRNRLLESINMPLHI